MKKIFYSAFFLLAGAAPLKGQDAFVQVIHACADPQADSVDVYVNDALTLDNFAHRNATSYLRLTADTYQIKIAGKNSTSSDDFIYQSPSLVLESGKYYTIVAAGLLSESPQPFGLFVRESRNISLQSANTDVLVFHGSTDAPVVDVTTAAGNSTLWNNLAYGQFGSYLELPENDYTIEVRDSSGSSAVASYEALLKGLDLGGKAITVVADGYLSPGSGQAAFGLFAVTPDGGKFIALPVSKAKVQIVHNSPNADSVDIYLNGGMLLNNFAFRTATGFVEVNAGTIQSIAVAPKTSGSVSDAIATIPLTFEANKSYVAVASGIVGGSGSTAFRLIAYADARQTASDTQNTDVLVFHGSTDAPTVDVTTGAGAATLVNNLSYGAFSSGYLPLPTDDYTVEVRNEAGTTVVASYQAPLKSLQLRKSAITVLASGFLAPTGNQPGFGLFAITASGGNFLALPVSKAKVQIVHNSPNADSVDIYLNGNKLLDNFAFRTATGFVEVNAGTVQSIAVAPKASGSVSDAIATIPLTFEANKNYVAVASGIVGGSGSTAFRLIAYAGARQTASDTQNTDVLVFHGSTDAPTVDVTTGAGAATLVNNLSYGAFSSGYLPLPTDDYTVEVRNEAGTTVVASYQAILKSLKLRKSAITVLASGFLAPTGNQPGFGLFAVTPNGGNFVALPVSKAKVQIIHNSPNADSVDIYLNGNRLLDNFAFRTATAYVEVNAGTVQSIAVAPKTSSSVSAAIATIPLTFEANKLYVAIASGIVGGSGDTAFRLIAYTPARDKSRLTGKTDVLIFHGSTNAPAVDVVVTGTTTVLADNLSYGNFNSVGYLELDPLNYSVDIVPAAGGIVVASYSAPLQTLNLANTALTVIASGYLNPGAGKPAFGLFVAPASQGALIPLPLNTTASRKDAASEAISLWPVPAGNMLNIQSGDEMLKITVFSPVGRLMQETTLNSKSHQLALNNMSPGVYLIQITTDKGVNTRQFIVE